MDKFKREKKFFGSQLDTGIVFIEKWQRRINNHEILDYRTKGRQWLWFDRAFIHSRRSDGIQESFHYTLSCSVDGDNLLCSINDQTTLAWSIAMRENYGGNEKKKKKSVGGKIPVASGRRTVNRSLLFTASIYEFKSLIDERSPIGRAEVSRALIISCRVR